MRLKKHGKLVRFGYLCTPTRDIPVQTTLCAFFWRTFVFMPVLCLGVLAAVVAVGLVAVEHPGVFFTVIGGVILVVAIGIGSGVLDDKLKERGGLQAMTSARLKDSVFIQGLKTLKGKVCPIIDIEP